MRKGWGLRPPCHHNTDVQLSNNTIKRKIGRELNDTANRRAKNVHNRQYMPREGSVRMTKRNEINHARAILVIALASLESGNTFECAKFLYAAGDAIDSVTHTVQQLNLMKGREAA